MFPQLSRGYDRAITVFSPDGRLLQVEYALAATKRATLAVGIKSKEGVALIAVKKHMSPLAEPPAKIHRIDKHIGAIAAGLVGDGLVLIDRSRVESQYNKLIYGEPITVKNLARKIALFKQQYTQYAGLRPFGVMMIFGGVDEQPELYITHPGGAFYSYEAYAAGMNSDKVNDILREEYNPDFSLEEAIILALKAITKAQEEELTPNLLEIAVITVKDREFKFLSIEEIKDLLGRVPSGEERTESEGSTEEEGRS